MNNQHIISKKRVLISGAGIAGLTAAYWLYKTGWDVVVIEKADRLREGEFVIDFSGTGWDVAAKMGLATRLKEQQMPIHALSFQNHIGQEQSNILMKDFIETMGVGDKHASINRKDLQNMIFDLVKDDIDIRFSTSIQSLKEDDKTSVQIVFNNGESEEFELVVGADGLHSNVRKLVFKEEAQYAKYLGYHVAAFRVKGHAGQQAGQMNILRKPNKQAGILDLRDGDALALFVYAKEQAKYVARKDRKQVLIDHFQDMGGPVPAVLNAIQEDTALYMDSTTQIVMPNWYSKRVALIGDAAYCLTLVSGQGASLAMAGAYILAKALEQHSDNKLKDALSEYDNRLRPFVEELQGKSRKFASQFIPAHRFGLWLTNKMVALTKLPFIKGYAGKLFSVKSLFEREEWKKYSD